jgi:1-acyl-sn-glycerol-3-phosphate acyltransferase
MNMYDPKFQFVFIAKNELNKKHNPVTSILNLIDSVYLDRADLRQQFQALQKQIEILKQKKSIVVFIEGHRYFTDEFGEFKAGALRVAYDTHSNIQPVIIYGSSGMLDKNKSNRNKKRTAYVEILKPLVPHDYNSHSASFISEELKNQMQKRYNTIRNKVKANKSPFGD